MDPNKTGNFIAEERKRKNYTQRQLAELLNVSDRTISKWECGKGFPEVSLLLPLCEVLELTGQNYTNIGCLHYFFNRYHCSDGRWAHVWIL